METSKGVEHLRYSIIWLSLIYDKSKVSRILASSTGKHCKSIYVIEFSITFALEACPQVRDKYLSTFVEVNCFAFELVFIFEARKVLDDQVYQTCRGAAGVFNACEEGALEGLISRC